MIKIYIRSTCSSCRKALNWLDSNQLEYQKVNLLRDGISRENLLEILTLSENGTEDVISTIRIENSIFRNENLEKMSLKRFISGVMKDHTMLKCPIIIDSQNLQVGYNLDEMRKFIPKAWRKFSLYKKLRKIE